MHNGASATLLMDSRFRQDKHGWSLERPRYALFAALLSCTLHYGSGQTLNANGGLALEVGYRLVDHVHYEAEMLNVASTHFIELSATCPPYWLGSQTKSAIVETVIDLSSTKQLAVQGRGTIVVSTEAGFRYSNGRNCAEVVDFAGDFSCITNPNMTFTPVPIILT